MIKEQTGFSPEKEAKFLARLDGNRRRANLEQELKTQLAEDFGLIEFSLKFDLDERGKIIDRLSDEEIVGLTARGGVVEETESIKQIEVGLKEFPESIWVHFSPKNEKLAYPSDCVDFWRYDGGEVIWNRVVVRNNLEEMNRVRNWLAGENKKMTEWEILASPVRVEGLNLGEIFELLTISETKNEVTKSRIDRTVERYIQEFGNEFGGDLTADKDLIFRLYSICYRALTDETLVINREEIESYMYGALIEARREMSFGCAATTMVGSFGEKIGYYILANGEVKKGVIPEGFKECKKCGCWYEGDGCPFCH